MSEFTESSNVGCRLIEVYSAQQSSRLLLILFVPVRYLPNQANTTSVGKTGELPEEAPLTALELRFERPL